MKFKDFFYEDFGFNTGDAVIYKGKDYTVSGFVDGRIELKDTTKTGGKLLYVNKDDIEALQSDYFGGSRSTEFAKRKQQKPRDKKAVPDSEQLSLF